MRSEGLVWRDQVVIDRSIFGEVAMIFFLLVQALDGAFTYIGISMYGIDIEMNPIIAFLVLEFGQGTALVATKSVASMLGIVLHLRQVHRAVFFLAMFYLCVAIWPWAAILMQ